MENTRLYIVSFGDSAEYRMEYAGTKEEFENSPRIKDLEKELAAYLKSKVAVGSHADTYATAKIKEVEAKDAAKYAGYPDFNDASVAKIKEVLLEEVQNMLHQKSIDRNAPYANIN